MDFYYLDLSAPCRSVMLTAKAVGVSLNKKPVDLFKREQLSPEYISINPQHCVPTIVDGDFVLWESRAICTYLVAQYGKDDSFYPKDPKTRAQIDRLLYFDMGTLYKRFRDYIYPVMFAGEKPCPDKLALVHDSLELLNGFLEGHSFSVSEHITVADFALVASVSTIVAAEIDISKYPNVQKWFERCKNQMIGYDSENEPGVKKYAEFAKSKLGA